MESAAAAASAAGKRKRAGGGGAGAAANKTSPAPASRRHPFSSAAPYRDSATIDVAHLVVDLAYVVKMGGCPKCGATYTKRHGRAKFGGKNYAKFLCKECSATFHEKSRRNQGTYRDRTYEGKVQLQANARYAYGELMREDIEKDRAEYQRKMAELQRQLEEKRRNISRLLGITSEEDSENPIRKPNAGKGSEGGPSSKNPFREMILLLGEKETPKLERVVSRMLARQSSISPSSTVDVQGDEVTNSEQQTSDEEQVDVVNDQRPMPAVECEGGYQFASRIVQDDGEEIEIYEKCADDNQHDG